MGGVVKVIGGIFVLVAIYLFLVNGYQTTAIIKTIAENSTAGIKVLQGRG